MHPSLFGPPRAVSAASSHPGERRPSPCRVVVPGCPAGLLLLCLRLVLAAAPAARAQESATLTALGSFNGGDLVGPVSSLVRGRDGNFYGTTGAASDQPGLVFRLTPTGVYTALHTFSDDAESQPSALLQGSDGNFYGTTSGNPLPDVYNDYGTIFRMTPTGVLTTLYTFGGVDGATPAGALAEGADGNFYGATAYGGAGYGVGTIFQVTPAGALTTLSTFTRSGVIYQPDSGLVRGGDSNFYGTSSGGSTPGGAAFQVTPAGVATALHEFPFAASGLVAGADGNLYGTTSVALDNPSGPHSASTIFQLTPTGAYTSVYTFGAGIDTAGLVPGSDGNLYGLTYNGLESPGAPVTGVFQLTPAGAYTTLYQFNVGEAETPNSYVLTQSSNGSFLGVISSNFAYQAATFFELTGSVQPSFFTGEETLDDGFYYLQFADANPFGYYSFLEDAHYLYHVDLGYEYVFDAADERNGVYLYDFASNDFFYTSPGFPFPYLYDFGLNATLYYYPDPDNAGHYTSHPRSFYNFSTGQIINR